MASIWLSMTGQNGLLRTRVSEPSDTVNAPDSPRSSSEPRLGTPLRPLPGRMP